MSCCGVQLIPEHISLAYICRGKSVMISGMFSSVTKAVREADDREVGCLGLWSTGGVKRIITVPLLHQPELVQTLFSTDISGITVAF